MPFNKFRWSKQTIKLSSKSNNPKSSTTIQQADSGQSSLLGSNLSGSSIGSQCINSSNISDANLSNFEYSISSSTTAGSNLSGTGFSSASLSNSEFKDTNKFPNTSKSNRFQWNNLKKSHLFKNIPRPLTKVSEEKKAIVYIDKYKNIRGEIRKFIERFEQILSSSSKKNPRILDKNQTDNGKNANVGTDANKSNSKTTTTTSTSNTKTVNPGTPKTTTPKATTPKTTTPKETSPKVTSPLGRPETPVEKLKNKITDTSLSDSSIHKTSFFEKNNSRSQPNPKNENSRGKYFFKTYYICLLVVLVFAILLGVLVFILILVNINSDSSNNNNKDINNININNNNINFNNSFYDSNGTYSNQTYSNWSNYSQSY